MSHTQLQQQGIQLDTLDLQGRPLQAPDPTSATADILPLPRTPQQNGVPASTANSPLTLNHSQQTAATTPVHLPPHHQHSIAHSTPFAPASQKRWATSSLKTTLTVLLALGAFIAGSIIIPPTLRAAGRDRWSVDLAFKQDYESRIAAHKPVATRCWQLVGSPTQQPPMYVLDDPLNPAAPPSGTGGVIRIRFVGIEFVPMVWPLLSCFLSMAACALSFPIWLLVGFQRKHLRPGFLAWHRILVLFSNDFILGSLGSMSARRCGIFILSYGINIMHVGGFSNRFAPRRSPKDAIMRFEASCVGVLVAMVLLDCF